MFNLTRGGRESGSCLFSPYLLVHPAIQISIQHIAEKRRAPLLPSAEQVAVRIGYVPERLGIIAGVACNDMICEATGRLLILWLE